jgi:hypothetical protein
VNGVPVTNQREHEQEKGNQQQTGSFRCIGGVAVMLVGIVGLVLRLHNGFIVRRTENDERK